MERAPKPEKEKSPVAAQEIRVFEGKKYRKVYSGYTIRQFFSHETLEKGPGPGWDARMPTLEKYEVNEPSELPDEPYYTWKLMEE